MNDRRTIGIDRPVKLEWLEAAAARLAAGDSERGGRDHVWKMLEGEVSGNTPYTARGKTMTVISRIWLKIPAERLPLRARALGLIERVTPEERLLIHWSMMLAAYPFFFDLAGAVGKSLRLHGSVALPQVVRRMTERWGDRSTLRTAVQRLIRMMVTFGVIMPGTARGEFVTGRTISSASEVAALAVEVLLLSGAERLSADDVRSHPALFPPAEDPQESPVRRRPTTSTRPLSR